MSSTPTEPRRLWLAVIVYTLAIYVSLYFVRGASNFLRDRGILKDTLYGVFILAGITLVIWLWRSRPSPGEILVLVGVAAAVVALLPLARAPEEQAHILQYGLLGGLTYKAFQATRARQEREGRAPGWSTRWIWLSAALLTGALGWLDEGIQAILPNRYYDLHDVAINAASGTLAAVGMALRDRMRRRASRPSDRSS